MNQTTFVSLSYDAKKKQTRRERFLHEIESMRRFAGIELGETPVPDETTIFNFRRLLEQHQLTAAFMNDGLEQGGLLLKGGTMVDATLIHAAPSTKNRDKSRDPDMHQAKKGMVPIGVAQGWFRHEDSRGGRMSIVEWFHRIGDPGESGGCHRTAQPLARR